MGQILPHTIILPTTIYTQFRSFGGGKYIGYILCVLSSHRRWWISEIVGSRRNNVVFIAVAREEWNLNALSKTRRYKIRNSAAAIWLMHGKYQWGHTKRQRRNTEPSKKSSASRSLNHIHPFALPLLTRLVTTILAICRFPILNTIYWTRKVARS